MKIFNIADYNVLPNLDKDVTQEIQKVFDMCKEGGGEVIIPKGKYNIASLRLYSNMTLKLQKDSILNGSMQILDYTDYKEGTTLGYAYNPYYIEKWNVPEYYNMALLSAFNEKNITIIGEAGSIINGNDCYDKNGEEGFRGPMGIVFSRCENIVLSGYEFINSANWSHQLDSSKKINISNVTITAGHDGVNLHHCSEIVIEDCTFATGDDCVAGYDIENLVVKNSNLNTACNYFRVGGSEILVENCRMVGPGKYPHLSKNTFYTHSILKHYSMAEEKNRHNTSITFDCCEVCEIDKIMNYCYGSKENLQDGIAMKMLVFKNCNISKVRDTTTILGNGEILSLEFVDSSIENINSYKTPLFILDDSIELKLTNTKLNGNAEIVRR